MLPNSQGAATGSGLSFRFHFRGVSALTAPRPPDEKLQGDINLYIHESAFPNLIQPYAGGSQWTDEFFARLQKEGLGDHSVELRIRENEERWSLQLDWLQPWSTRITPEGLRFTLRASGFSIDGKNYNEPVAIESTFVPVREVGPLFGWERVGDVAIDAAPSLEGEAREFLRRKFSGFFLERFFLDGLEAPAGGAWDELSNFRPTKVELADGWLLVEYQRRAAQGPAPIAANPASPAPATRR
jgi:hypothetical protein